MRAFSPAIAHTVEAAVEAYLDYVAHQLAQGVPLNAMTRHMLGLFNGAARRAAVPPPSERERDAARARASTVLRDSAGACDAARRGRGLGKRGHGWDFTTAMGGGDLGTLALGLSSRAWCRDWSRACWAWAAASSSCR